MLLSLRFSPSEEPYIHPYRLAASPARQSLPSRPESLTKGSTAKPQNTAKAQSSLSHTSSPPQLCTLSPPIPFFGGLTVYCSFSVTVPSCSAPFCPGLRRGLPSALPARRLSLRTSLLRPRFSLDAQNVATPLMQVSSLRFPRSGPVGRDPCASRT